MIGTITLRLFFIGAKLHIWKICQNRGHGERNPHQVCREAKSTKWVLSNSGESCPDYPEFGIKKKEVQLMKRNITSISGFITSMENKRNVML